MKLGVFAVLLSDRPLEPMLDAVVELGLDAVELGTGAYPGNAHCNPGELLSSDRKLRAFRDAIRALSEAHNLLAQRLDAMDAQRAELSSLKERLARMETR